MGVDKNQNNTLDFREFLRIMRLDRESTLQGMRLVYDRALDPTTHLLPRHKLEEALMSLGHDRVVATMRTSTLPAAPLDFDSFVRLADAMHAEVVTQERKKAGFADEELEQFKKNFNFFDRDGSGEIDTMELIHILKSFNIEPKSRDEQLCLVDKIDLARAEARKCGVESEREDGHHKLRFWSFVQLMRILQNEHDKAEEEMMQNFTIELGFTLHEAEEFRQIFREWYERESGAQTNGLVDRFSGRGNCLPKDVVKRMVRSLGVKKDKDNARTLAIITQLDEQLLNLETEPGAGIDFHGFLSLMRWLVDSNIGGHS